MSPRHCDFESFVMERQVRHASVEAAGMDRQTPRPLVLQGPSVDLGGEDESHEMEVDAQQTNGDRKYRGGEDEDKEIDGKEKCGEADDKAQREDESR